MGLSITAYEIATLVAPHTHCATDADAFQDQCYDAGHVKAFIPYEGFSRSLAGLEAGQYYECSGRTLDWGMSCGSYSYFREQLSLCLWGQGRGWAEDIEPEAMTDRPLYEVIWFSDCEGTIGPDAARKIASDLGDCWERLGDWFAGLPEPGWSKRLTEFGECFSLAAGTGLVEYS